ncbi:MAG: anaerobic glycerol-3-phosphate dehydrogenase subunit B [Bacteroidales bacterium]|nr:anaerobic glycerol-3-phosphate dehydrogenase subunit B [Bacteroidales bacterium]
MRFDTVIIGGGLAGLTAGISLQEAGQKVAIVSAGQNAMHFFSGSFEEAGPVRERVSALFAAAGVRMSALDGLQLMPMGKFQPVSLTLEDVTVFPEEHVAEKALIVNFTGFHDFYCTFLAETLEKAGTACRIRFVRLPEMEHLRTSPSEMRSVNIARVLDEYWEKAVSDIRILLGDEDLIILPQVFGLKDASVLDKIRTALPARVAFVGTMPPSVPGIRTQMLLKRRFEVLGGTFLMGDEVTSAALHEGVVSSITTRNLDTARLFADHFILASGGYFSKGLVATPSQVYEPLFGLDIGYPTERKDWYDADFFAQQPFMDFGVKTDASLHAVKDGEPVKNLFCIGSVLGGTRKEDFGTAAGLAIRTAFAVVDTMKGGNL